MHSISCMNLEHFPRNRLNTLHNTLHFTYYEYIVMYAERAKNSSA